MKKIKEIKDGVGLLISLINTIESSKLTFIILCLVSMIIWNNYTIYEKDAQLIEREDKHEEARLRDLKNFESQLLNAANVIVKKDIKYDSLQEKYIRVIEKKDKK